MGEGMTTALARHSTVVELVAAFREAEATVRRTFAAIDEAEKRLNAAFLLDTEPMSHGIKIDASHSGAWDSFDEPDRCIDRMARRAWEIIIERLELRRMMSIKRYADLEKQLRDGPLPDVTEENVAAFAQQYLDALPEMLTEAVSEVYEWLRPGPYSKEYKTNSKYEIRSKVVLERCVQSAWIGEGFRVSDYACRRLVALENVFNSLDGKGQIAKSYKSELEMAIDASGASGGGETPLFRFRSFKNGNLHIEFLRLDLLKRFNQIAGGRRLKPEVAA
jgi:hypothetical protein